MIAGRQVHLRPVLTVFAGLALAILLSLGNWQLERLEWKRDLIAKVEARIGSEPVPVNNVLKRAAAGEDMEYTPVTMSGVYADAGEAKVFGTHEGAPGYFLFSPLMRVEAEQRFDPVIYINRGFVPQAVELHKATADGSSHVVAVSGLFRHAEQPTPPASWFLPQKETEDGYWFVRDPVRFAGPERLPVGAYYIDSFGAEAGGFPKGGTTRLDFRNKHLEYALTWFGLAGALFAVWLAMSLRPKTSLAQSAK